MSHPVGKAAAAVVGVVLAWRMASELGAEKRAPDDDDPPRRSIVVTQTDGTRITVASSAVRAADGWEDDDTSRRHPKPRRRSGRGGLNDSGDAVEAIVARAAIGAGLAPPGGDAPSRIEDADGADAAESPRRTLGGRALASDTTPAPTSTAAALRAAVRESDEAEPAVDVVAVVAPATTGARVATALRAMLLVIVGVAGLALTSYAVTSPYGASALPAALGGLVLVIAAWHFADSTRRTSKRKRVA